MRATPWLSAFVSDIINRMLHDHDGIMSTALAHCNHPSALTLHQKCTLTLLTPFLMMMFGRRVSISHCALLETPLCTHVS